MDSGPLNVASSQAAAELFKRRFANVVERLCVVEAALEQKTAECLELRRQLGEREAGDGG